MLILKKYCFILTASSILFFSCSGSPENQTEKKEVSSLKSLEKANRYLVRTEAEDIENYIRRHGWTMEETGTGLRFEIYKKGNGEQAEKGRFAILNYKTWLINGNLIYSSDELGQKEFKIGKGGVESGLEEAMLMMHVGDKARLVIPSHLAFGLLGDNNKIPPRSIVVYDIELVTLK
jgi:FKBP-type peptidyl-prolyl cis-trans isomerase